MPKKLEISCVAYQRPKLLTCLLWSLASQTSSNFVVTVYHDGHNEEIENIVKSFKSNNPDIDITYYSSSERFNDYGHTLREMALHRSSADYLLLTNDDNYYVPIFVEEILREIDNENPDIVYFDMVHSHIMGDLPNPIGYQTLITEPRLNRIDIGSFVFRTELGKVAGFTDREFNADGRFFERMLEFSPKLKKIEKVLFVHN